MAYLKLGDTAMTGGIPVPFVGTLMPDGQICTTTTSPGGSSGTYCYTPSPSDPSVPVAVSTPETPYGPPPASPWPPVSKAFIKPAIPTVAIAIGVALIGGWLLLKPEKKRRRNPRGSWTAKDERKYEHIKEGYLSRGKSLATAQRIAAATVNRDRAARR